MRQLLKAQLPDLPDHLRAGLYDDADRIDSWGPGQEQEVERRFAPLLH